MSEVQKNHHSLSLIDLTNDNKLLCNHTDPYIDFEERNDRRTNHSPNISNLTDYENQHVTSDIPVIDLTGDDDHFLNYRIPVIDLTDDDVYDITNQTDCIDLTYNEAPRRSNYTIHNFDIGNIDDRVTNRSTNPTDLILDGNQVFTPNTSVTDITCDADRDLNLRIRCTDTKDVQNISHQLKNFVLSDGSPQIGNYCILTNDLKNHSNSPIITDPDMINGKDCNNDRRQIIDSIRKDGEVNRKLVDDDVEMCDLSCNYSLESFQNGVIENNLRIPAENLRNVGNENDFLKYSETANINAMHTDTFSNMQKTHGRKENVANHPLENFKWRKETNSMNYPLKDFKYRKETNLTNNRQRRNYEEKIDTDLTNHPLTNSPKEKYSRRRQSEEITQYDTEDFMKPARHPIPLRHSLGRSTINTSKNVPIECTEDSEDETRLLTVSSIIRRKKSKPVTNSLKTDLPKSKELSTSTENTFSFETLKRLFLKLWLFLLFTFIGLYYLL